MTDTPRLTLAVENGLLLEAVFNALQHQCKSGLRADIQLLCEEPEALDLPESFDPVWPTHHPDTYGFAPAEILLLASHEPSLREAVERALSAGCHVVDLTRQWANDPRAIVADATALADVRLPHASGALLVLPEGDLLQLLALLRPLARLLPLQSVMVTLMQPASVGGQRSVEALVRQSAQVLNARGVGELDVFPTQLCFNLLPSSAALDEFGQAPIERAVEQRLAYLLGVSELHVEAHAVQAGTFFGNCQTLSIAVDDYVSLDTVRMLIRESEQLVLDETTWYSPSAVRAGELGSEYAVGRLRVSRLRDNWLKCWTVGDSEVKGSAASALALVRFLADSYI